MGEYQTGAGPMRVLRAHLKAIRTESARRDAKERGVAGLAARERLVHRLEPLPERLAALNSRVTVKIEELGGTLSLFREAQSDASSNCNIYLDLACAAYQIGDDSTDRDDQAFWYSFGEGCVDSFLDCIHR